MCVPRISYLQDRYYVLLRADDEDDEVCVCVCVYSIASGFVLCIRSRVVFPSSFFLHFHFPGYYCSSLFHTR